MSNDVEVGCPSLSEYSNTREYDNREPDQEEFRVGQIYEDNENGIYQINSESQDFLYRSVYWEEGNHPTKGGLERANPGNNYPLDTEIRVWPNDPGNTDIDEGRPKSVDSGENMYATSITGSIGVGVGPFSAGLSVSFPFDDGEGAKVNRDPHEYGWHWTIDAEDSWPTSPASPDDSSEIDELPTVECMVDPDAEGDDWRWVNSDAKFNWKYYGMDGYIYQRSTGWIWAPYYYERV